MVAITHRGITYTGTGTFTTAVDIDLPLQAGVDQDDTTWLTAYPGALTSFAARQADGANRMQPRLICLSLSTALAEGNTLTLSGDVNVILSGMCASNSVADADLMSGVHMSTSGLVATFSIELVTDGTTNDTSPATVWLLVA